MIIGFGFGSPLVSLLMLLVTGTLSYLIYRLTMRPRRRRDHMAHRPAESTPALDFERLTVSHTSRYAEDIRTLLPSYEALYVVLDAYLRPLVPPNGHVLVAGAGGGMELVSLGRTHPDWQFTAVDPAPQMLALARTAAQTAGVADRVAFYEGEVAQSPDVLHNAACCILVLHFVVGDDAKRALLQAIASRLQQGAPLLLVSVFGDPDSEDFARHCQALYDQALAATGHERLAAKLRSNIATTAAVPEDRLLDLLSSAGFDRTTRFFQTYQIGGWVAYRGEAKPVAHK